MPGHVTRGNLSQQELCPQTGVEMPLSNKPVSGAAAAVLDQQQQPPPSQLTAVGGASGEQEDPEIIKSPSDPKKYR